MPKRPNKPAAHELAGSAATGISFDVQRSAAFSKWQPTIHAASEGAENVISIYDTIGADFWGDGITSKRVAGALRRIGNQAVTVNINSPGGDFFEGAAIYNLLRDHPHEVTVKVVGLAASAASVIAMAGDKIEIADLGFMMVHNAWVLAMGNRHDLTEFADTLEVFDTAVAEVYAARAEVEPKTAHAWMDAETWFAGKAAIEAGLADEILEPGSVAEVEPEAGSTASRAQAMKTIEQALRDSGNSRAASRSLIGEIASRRGDDDGKRSAVASEALAGLHRLADTLAEGKTP